MCGTFVNDANLRSQADAHEGLYQELRDTLKDVDDKPMAAAEPIPMASAKTFPEFPVRRLDGSEITTGKQLFADKTTLISIAYSSFRIVR